MVVGAYTKKQTTKQQYITIKYPEIMDPLRQFLAAVPIDVRFDFRAPVIKWQKHIILITVEFPLRASSGLHMV